MSTIRNPDEHDPREIEDCEETGYTCFKVGDRVYLKWSRETGIVVRTWFNEYLQCQECFICFDDGGNPERKLGSCKPYVLKYLCSSMILIEDGEEPPSPWSLEDDSWDTEEG